MTPLLLVVSTSAIYLHEVMIFLSPILAISTILRATSEPRRWTKLWYYGLAGWFLLVLFVQLDFVVIPRSSINRDLYAENLIQLRWLIANNDLSNVNAPALNGLMGMVAITSIWALVWKSKRLREERLVVLVYTFFTIMSLAVVVWSTMIGGFPHPHMQFAARNHAAFLSILLSVLAVISLRQSSIRLIWERSSTLVIVTILAVGSLGWQSMGTISWSRFVGDFEFVLSHKKGLVPWEEAIEDLPSKDKRNFLRMEHGWTAPSLSFMLAEDGKVSTIISNRSNRSAAWNPFDPTSPEDLPHSPMFDTSAYRAEIERQK